MSGAVADDTRQEGVDEIVIQHEERQVPQFRSFGEQPVRDGREGHAVPQKRFDDEYRRRKAAQEQRDAALRRVEALQNELSIERGRSNEADVNTAKARKESAEAQLHRARQDLRTAIEKGDVEGQATASEKIADAQVEIRLLERSKPAQRQEEQRSTTPPPQRAQDPQLARWLEDNPRMTTDPKFQAQAMSVHHEMMADGIPPTSNNYWSELDKRLKSKLGEDEPAEHRDEPEDEGGNDVVPPPRPVARGAAPTRTTAPPSRNGKRTVTLSAAERSTASMMGMSDDEYARSKLELIQRGNTKYGQPT